MEYNLKGKIEAALARKKKKKDWLHTQLGISEKTLYNYKKIGKLNLEMILKLSSVLNFNFLEDYNNFLRESHEPAITSWREEEIEYKRLPKHQMTVTLHIRGDDITLGLQLNNVIKVLKKECDSYGLELV